MSEIRQKLKLNKEGFITNWLISGPVVSPFKADFLKGNQLEYEKYLRSIVSDKKVCKPDRKVKLDENSELGMPWKYYHSKGNWFVDFSNFYHELEKIDLFGAANLYCEKELDISATLWTYCAIDLWVDDKHICKIDEPVYKPIIKKDITLHLHKGLNQVFIKMQNLGVRDTRNQYGLQINESTNEVFVTLPDEENVSKVVALDEWLAKIEYKEGKLLFDGKAPCDIDVKYGNKVYRIESEQEMDIKTTGTKIEISGIVEGQKLSRQIEIIGNVVPVYNTQISKEENIQQMYRDIASIEKTLKSEGVYFSIYNILARRTVNRISKSEKKNILENLDAIEKRVDCADFLVVALLRLINEYKFDNEIMARVEEVLLGFRYWMDEEGADGMCFWSENHALLFYGCALVAGKMYPDKIFTRSMKKGIEVHEIARQRCLDWLRDIENDGFEEFLCGGYMVITLGGLLNLIDYGDKDISERASVLADQLIEGLAKHTFKGSVIAPQGRVYRSVIYPFTQGVQSIINMINPKSPYSAHAWLVSLNTSKYRIKDKLVELMEQPLNTKYGTGNALIKLVKEHDYLLTSVESLGENKKPRNWENISLNTKESENNYQYIKSLNERYHGTTDFKPGVYGYQQHMWYGALDNDCAVFTNHPGGTYDESSMRPGYWYGNGVIPALKQENNLLGVIYAIPDDYPIKFTHLFWPTSKFDEVIKEGNWIFGRREKGYIGIWCSNEMVPHNDQLFNCEYRANSQKSAYLCKCSSQSEAGSFSEFRQNCHELDPQMNLETMSVSTTNGFKLKYVACEDWTQYV